MKLQLKRSNVLEGGSAKAPTTAQMEYGELAVNYNLSDPCLFLKDSNNNIIRIDGNKEYIDGQIAAIPSVDLTPYDTSVQVDAKIAANTPDLSNYSGNIQTDGNVVASAVPTDNAHLVNKLYADNLVAGVDLSGIATNASAITALTNGAPALLNTLNELAAAINNDENFSTTITNQIAEKLPLTGGTVTGNLTVNTTFQSANLTDGVTTKTMTEILGGGVDSNGNFTVSGTVTAQHFNATSDIALKQDINVIDNALEMINNLNGIAWNWKNTGEASMGVSAQDVEAVAPELVGQGQYKSVNYNGLVGMLIEAVKSLSSEVKMLKSQIS